MDSILISFDIFISGVVLRWSGIGLGLPQVKTSVVPSVIALTPSLIITGICPTKFQAPQNYTLVLKLNKYL
jgi:hypothetical protein